MTACVFALLFTGCASTPSIAGECFLMQRIGSTGIRVVNAAECDGRSAVPAPSSAQRPATRA